MRDRIVYNMLIENLLFSLLMLVSVSIMAENYEYEQGLSYSPPALFETTGSSYHMENDYTPVPDPGSRRNTFDALMPVQSYLAETNPWLLPEKAPETQRFNRYPHSRHSAEKDQSKRYYQEDRQSEVYRPEQKQPEYYTPESNTLQPYHESPYQGGRFVTPEIMDSLKRQQMYFQQAPEDNYNNGQPRSPGHRGQAEPFRTKPLYGQDSYNYPSSSGMVEGLSGSPGSGLNRAMNSGRYDGSGGIYDGSINPGGINQSGMSNSNPLYDAPLTSPWGSGPDVLYRGESLPDSFPGSFTDSFSGAYPNNMLWVPGEAIGGLPPIQIPSYDYKQYADDNYDPKSDVYNPANPDSYIRENAFNPLNFMPDSNIK